MQPYRFLGTLLSCVSLCMPVFCAGYDTKQVDSELYSGDDEEWDAEDDAQLADDEEWDAEEDTQLADNELYSEDDAQLADDEELDAEDDAQLADSNAAEDHTQQRAVAAKGAHPAKSVRATKNARFKHSSGAVVQSGATQSRYKPTPKPRRNPDDVCTPDIQPYQINLKHIERKGIGYDTGYTTLGGFFTTRNERYLPFLDVRGHVFDDGKFAANAGVGFRYLRNPQHYMLGINGFYDYRHTKHGHFNQAGAGLEALYAQWEFHANGYLPFGNKNHTYDTTLTGVSFKRFSGNQLLINEFYSEKAYIAMKGFNAEIGWHPLCNRRDWDLYVGAGPYYFNADEGNTTWGGKARINIRVAKYLTFEVSDSYDHLFHNRLQGTIALNLPFGGRKTYPTKKKAGAAQADCFSNYVTRFRSMQPVERQEILVINKHKRNVTVDPVAISTITGQPFHMLFVNNTAGGGGNGTFEHPFNTLSAAQAASVPYDIVYVFAGNGTSSGQNVGFAIKANQRLLGSAAAHNFSSTKGLVTVPAQTTAYPQITNAGNSNVIISAVVPGNLEDIDISGLYIVAATVGAGNASCIDLYTGGNANPTRVNNFLAHDNVLVGTGTTTSFGSGYAIQVGLVDQSSTAYNNIVENLVFPGFAIFSFNRANSGGPTVSAHTTMTVNNNFFAVTGNPIGIIDSSGGGSDVFVTNNTLYQVNIGGTVGSIIASTQFAGPTPSRYTISGNAITASPQHLALSQGITMSAQATGHGNYEVFNNTITGYDLVNDSGILATSTSTATVMCANIHDNTVTQSTVGYNLDQVAPGIMRVEPLINNVGSVFISGNPIFVPPGFCE